MSKILWQSSKILLIHEGKHLEESVFSGSYQISIQLRKQQKAINGVANHFSESMGLISAMHDNFKEHKSLLKKVLYLNRLIYS